ncbi:hypothetical protein ATCC90586_010737 [Pythium insidiosum]|nr:hypothetical protein ATCC90586_010737 [Pythium insidiosum]
MSTRQWGGDEELYAAVWFIREPIFVIGVEQDSHASVRVIWLDRPNPSEREEIYHHLPAPDEAFELFRAFLHHRVTPVVLVHADSHFNCLRFNERFYKDWTADDASGAKMRDRLDQVLGQLGWYVAPTAAFSTSVTPPQVQPQPSGSLFVPSETSVDEPEPPVSDEPLSPISHYALLSALNPRRRRRGPFALLWQHAERLNSAAYTQWNAAQVIPAPTIEPTDLQRACRDWSAQPAALLALLRALPYPEVAVSLLPADVVLRLGNELTALSADRGVPAFVHADDPADAGHLWAKLVVLVTVAADPDVDAPSCIQWLRAHPRESTLALHALRLYDWTFVAELARACATLSDPNRPETSAQPITVVCVYAPTATGERERFFQSLLAMPRPVGAVAVGGDFNCVLEPELDRSRFTTRDQMSESLSALIAAWNLVDAVSDDILGAQTRSDVTAFQQRYHSYYYATTDAALASARLDRWYVSRTIYSQVGRVRVSPPVARSDHDSVCLQLITEEAVRRSTQPRKRPPQLRYPLPAVAEEAVLACGRAIIASTQPQLLRSTGPDSAALWDAMKTRIRRESLVARRAAVSAASARSRMKARRLHKALNAIKTTTSPVTPHDATVDGVTRRLAALSLDPIRRYRSLRAHLIACQTAASARTRLRCHARHAGTGEDR